MIEGMKLFDTKDFNLSVEHIEEIFSYKIVTDPPQIIVDRIKKNTEKYLPGVSDDIQKAFEFSHMAHEGQKRLSWELYITHPLKSAEILLFIKPDLATIQACILHDVIEDTTYTYEDIEANFGKEVADLCEWLSKVSSVRYSHDERQLETLKKTFLAMAKDLRVIFIKLADRIHNIQTLWFHPKEEKRKRIALETMKIYASMAKKLGLFQYQLYLENGAFKILEPEMYKKIMQYLKREYRNAPTYIKQGKQILNKILKEWEIHNFYIKARLKSPYRIYEKLKTKYNTMDFSKVLDVLAFRLITDSVAACYNVLGVVHSHYRPMIHKIKDYIAVPKFNNYQSLHTTILGMFPFPTEIQIRTQEMDDIAEYGVAAHFAYSDKTGSSSISHQQSKWIKELQKIVNDYTTFESKEEFKDNLNIELLHKNIFLYTPKGDVVEMPENSTVLDFAFRIHSEVGLRFKNALINGAIKPISYRPKTGDVVTINTFRTKYVATKYWLDFLHTPTARAKLTKFLKNKNKEEYMKKWVDILNKQLQIYELPLLYSPGDEFQKKYSEKKLEKNLMLLADKQITPTSLIKKVYTKEVQIIEEMRKKETQTRIMQQLSGDEKIQVAIIDTDKKLQHTLCPLCKPTIKHKIIAKTGKQWIKIHSTDCRALKTVLFDRLLEAHWSGEAASIYAIKLTIAVHHSAGSLVSIMALFAELNINIENIVVEKHSEEVFYVIIQSSYNNPAKLWMIINDLKKHDSFITIVKKEIA